MIPVMIITLCRYEHLLRCICSLQKNSNAENTDLYIGLDYPADEKHWSGYKKIEKYLDNKIVGFKSVNVIKHQSNLGPTGNYKTVRDIIIKSHDGYIFSEDDNVFSPNFLEYMNICMEYYKEDKNVIAVSGYMYPITVTNDNANILQISTYFSAYGFGMYRDKDAILEKYVNMETFLKMYYNIKLMRKLKKTSPNQFCNFVKGMVEYTPDLVNNNKIRPTDLAWGLYIFFHNYKVIFPTVSKVRNNGYDGSGVNCLSQNNIKGGDTGKYREYDFSLQEIDKMDSFSLKNAQCVNKNKIDEEVSLFFSISRKEMFRTIIAYSISLVIGRRNTASIIKRIMNAKGD